MSRCQAFESFEICKARTMRDCPRCKKATSKDRSCTFHKTKVWWVRPLHHLNILHPTITYNCYANLSTRLFVFGSGEVCALPASLAWPSASSTATHDSRHLPARWASCSQILMCSVQACSWIGGNENPGKWPAEIRCRERHLWSQSWTGESNMRCIHLSAHLHQRFNKHAVSVKRKAQGKKQLGNHDWATNLFPCILHIWVQLRVDVRMSNSCETEVAWTSLQRSWLPRLPTSNCWSTWIKHSARERHRAAKEGTCKLSKHSPDMSWFYLVLHLLHTLNCSRPCLEAHPQLALWAASITGRNTEHLTFDLGSALPDYLCTGPGTCRRKFLGWIAW